MMRFWGAVAMCLGLALPAAAQVTLTQPDVAPRQVETETGQGAVVRGLDRVNGETVDLQLNNGQSAVAFGLLVTLQECRYPANNPTGDAFAFLTITDRDSGETFFQGWMIASAPALNALDHSRYDVWALRCKTS